MKQSGKIILAIILMAGLYVPVALSQAIPGDQVRKSVEDYIGQLSVPSTEFTTEFTDLKASYHSYSKSYSLEVASANSSVMKGLVTFLVKVKSRAVPRSDQTIPVTVRIRTFERVLVAARTIQPHVEIAPADVRTVRAETTDLPSPVSDVPQLKAKWTSRWIQEGKPLTFDMFEDEPVIKRGDEVSIVVRTRNVVVREQGNALQDGKMNDIISVTNESRDNLRGRVIGKGEVVLVE